MTSYHVPRHTEQLDRIARQNWNDYNAQARNPITFNRWVTNGISHSFGFGGIK